MDIFGATHMGLVRENNEDAFIIKEISSRYLLAVAGGMGGANAGEVASDIAIKSLAEQFSNGAISATELLKDAVALSNTYISKVALADEDKYGMGSTLATTIISDDTITVAHVGDSRVYLLTDGKLKQLTTDHSYVQELVDSGIITAKEAEKHPKKNLITRVLGLDTYVQPDIVEVKWKGKDALLICSDGLDCVTYEELQAILKRKSKSKFKVEKLINLANERGGKDNVTIIIAQR